ncbi:hypothetical protein C0991_003672 [Blastosporella zonata]|nr:hypothetical protein C0991_003672 [Blastosporella zonata]
MTGPPDTMFDEESSSKTILAGHTTSSVPLGNSLTSAGNRRVFDEPTLNKCKWTPVAIDADELNVDG